MQQKPFLSLTLGLIGVLALISIYSCNKNSNTQPAITLTDKNGNVYKTVKIGDQIWMAENFRGTLYNDSTTIPNVTDSIQWITLSTGARCYYDNDSNKYAAIYGPLYNWYAVNHTDKDGKPNLAPTGWHVPDTTDWKKLIIAIGGKPVNGTDTTVGGKLKEAAFAHWSMPNFGADNSSGFTALPAGARYGNGDFGNIGRYNYFWSSTKAYNDWAWYLGLNYIDAGIFRSSISKIIGSPVRFVKD